ncbi:MAG TPA: MMPL family transporter, partial [Acidimicrobiales bacterium]|nr:MMPL family transporter [Acidimicrobiales bacterium]
MKSLARLAVRRRWYVLTAWIVLFIGLTIASQSVGTAFSNSFSLPGTDSSKAFALLGHVKSLGGDADQIVFRARSGTIADQRAAIEPMLAKVAKLPEVASVTSPFCATSAACLGATQVSKDGRIAYAVVHFAVPGFKLSNAQIRAVETVG